jgi:activating signal cointegrator 1
VREDHPTKPRIPVGAVVAIAQLVDCVPICAIEDEDPPPCLAVGPTDLTLWGVPDYWHHEADEVDVTDQRPFGDFTPGRWAWLLDDIRPLPEPVPARGRQGLWTPSYEEFAHIGDQIEAVAHG